MGDGLPTGRNEAQVAGNKLEIILYRAIRTSHP